MNRRWHSYIDHVLLIVLAVSCYLLFFHRLGDVGMLGPDEPRYAGVARAMFQSGDYITPRLNGQPWFEKPVLMYWGAALGYKLFGVNEMGARFPSALSATFCVMLIFWCGRRLWNSTVGFMAFARAASMDMPLTACLTAALVFFLVGVSDGTSTRRRWFYLFYAAIGLGVLAKGPVAFLLPAISLFCFLWIRGAWDEWRTWHPEGVWIALLVALPWYIACTWMNGYEFIRVFIINHNLARFASTVHGHQRPIYFYLPVVLLLTFPWTYMLIPTLRRHFARNEQLIAWWAIVPFVFFSLSGSKLPGYILPMVPSVALLCARELLQPSSSRTFKVATYIEAGTMAFIGVAFGFYGTMINIDPHVSGMLIAVITFSMAIMLSLIALWLTPRFLAAFNATAIVALVLVATSFVFPRFDRTETMKPWEQALGPIVPPGQMVFLYRPARWMEYGLQFYRNNNAMGVGSPEELSGVIGQSRVLCIAEDKTLDELTRQGKLDIEVVHTIGNQTAFWVWHVE